MVADDPRAEDDAVAHLRALGYVDPLEQAAQQAEADRLWEQRLQGGAAALRNGDFAGALAVAELLVADDPQAIAPRRLRAEALYRSSRYAAAHDELQWLEQHGVERADVALLRARVEAALRHWDAALEWADYAAHLLQADAAWALLVTADVCRRLRRHDEAERAYRAALEHAGARTAALAGLGALYVAERRLDEAVVSLLDAVETRFNQPTAHAWLARALQLLGRPDEARAARQTAERLGAKKGVRSRSKGA
jgi:tetratricopeptide (TPR) repeat protein